MKKTLRMPIAAAAFVALVCSFVGPSASAHQRDGVVRVNVPVHGRGAETVKLDRLIQRQRHLDADDYRLMAVVIDTGPFSRGYASLRVGDRKTGRYFLSSRGNVRIASPGAANDHWHLRLGPGTHVRTVTLVLQPRRTSYAARRGHVDNRSGLDHVDHHRVGPDRGWAHRQTPVESKQIRHRHDRAAAEASRKVAVKDDDRRSKTREADDDGERDRDSRPTAGGQAFPKRRT
ncbi:MAG: hypothetical protein P8Y69_09715 [Gammaproteobacteria bacterium]